MRYQGRITEWNEARGFGFVMPNGGGEHAFVHIHAFVSKPHQPPAVNQLITYRLTRDERGRARVEQAQLVSLHPRKKAGPHGPGRWRVRVAGVFLAGVVALVLTGALPRAALWVYLGLSVMTYALYAHDKAAAQARRWRIRENTLQLWAVLGGWPGALLAQQHLHHKNRKASFQFMFWVMVLLNVGALGWLVSAPGARWLTALMGR